MKKETERVVKEVKRFCDICKEYIDDEHEWETRSPCAICDKDICHKCADYLNGWIERNKEDFMKYSYSELKALVCKEHLKDYQGFEVKVTSAEFKKNEVNK